MKNENKVKQTVLITGAVIVILLFTNFLPLPAEIWGVKLKPVDLVSDLREKEDGQQDNQYKYEYKFEENDEYDFNLDEKASAQESTTVNKASLNVFPALFSIVNGFGDAVNDNLASPKADIRDIRITGNVAQLKPFFEALRNSKENIVRIGHFGDSIIGGDLITMDFREALQKRFGGDAVGLMDITSQDVKFRMTTKHSFSDNWKESDNMRNPGRLPLGITGSVFVPQGPATVEYATTNHYPYLEGYKTVKVFYSGAKPSEIKCAFNGSEKSAKLETGDNLKQAVFTNPQPAKSVKLTFPEKEQAYFYAVSLENGPGLYVDNLSFQGQSGEKLEKIPLDKLKEFNDMLNYKLIIFQFGLNVVDKIEKNPAKYEKDMVDVINHFKQAFPNTGFLLVGVNDKGYKRGRNITTDPNVLTLLAVQQAIVEKTGIAFWNLFEAMGGEGSMEQWVNSDPPMASSDYTHFNDKGAAKVSELLANAITGAYDAYVKAVSK